MQMSENLAVGGRKRDHADQHGLKYDQQHQSQQELPAQAFFLFFSLGDFPAARTSWERTQVISLCRAAREKAAVLVGRPPASFLNTRMKYLTSENRSCVKFRIP
jgi:hypothetical protein